MKKSPYYANTYWNTRFKFSGVRFEGEVALIEGFEFILELSPQGSWVKKGKQTTELLKHEQGHFDVGLLFMNEVLQKIKAASFSRTNYMAEIKAMISELHSRFTNMNDQYDTETGHGLKKDVQDKWNSFFDEKLR